MSDQGKDLFAVVHFTDKPYEEKRDFAVIRYSWITENGNKFVGPPFENGEFELEALKNDTVSRPGWIEYYCLVLKYDIGNIKAANIERDLIIKKDTDRLTLESKCNLDYVEADLSNIRCCLDRIEDKMEMIQKCIEKLPQSET